jgi:hypothetical protein
MLPTERLEPTAAQIWQLWQRFNADDQLALHPSP